MSSPRILPVVSLGLAVCSLVLMFWLAPADAALWQKVLGGVLCVTFAFRLPPLFLSGRRTSARLAGLAAALPVLFLAVAVFGFPQWWAVLLAVASWGAAFLMRRAA